MRRSIIVGGSQFADEHYHKSVSALSIYPYVHISIDHPFRLPNSDLSASINLIVFLLDSLLFDMTARRPQEWPYTSPYYDAMTMDGQEFQHNNSFIKFTEGPLTCVRIKNGSVDRMDVHARSPAERAAFASDQETFDPDITILWVDYAWALAHVHGYSTYLELDPKNWTWLLETMNIHPVFVHLLHTQANQSVKYVTYNEDGTQPESVHIIILQKLLLPDFKMDIVSLYFRYDIKSGKSLGLVLERSPALMVDYMTEYLSSQDESPSFLAALLILLKPLSIRLESELSRVVERIIANRDPDQVSRRIYYHGPQSRQSRQSRQTDLTEYNHAALHVSGINMRRLVFSLERQSKLMGLLLAALQEIASWNETDGSYSAKVRVKDKQLAEAIQFHDGQITSDLEVSYLTDHDLKSRLHAVSQSSL